MTSAKKVSLDDMGTPEGLIFESELAQSQSSLTLRDNSNIFFTRRWFCDERPFANPCRGNKVTWLRNGREAFESMAEAIRGAEHFVWITDWQMGFDVELSDRGQPGHPGRLIKIIASLIRSRAVAVRILIYNEPLWSGTGQVYDRGVKARFDALSDEARQKGYPGSVVCYKQNSVGERGALDDFSFSHHQKSVVVDGGTAFIGGIDLTYGRYCGSEFDVVIDPDAYVLNEMYNPCAKALRGLTTREAELVKQGFNLPPSGTLLEEGCQPRMPWQDVHIKIEGPAAVDVHRNFSRRWRAASDFGDAFEKRLLPKLIPVLKAARQRMCGTAQVQIVRSASSRELIKETHDPSGDYFLDPPDLQLDDTPPDIAQTWHNSLQAWQWEPQDNIFRAMLNCINSAENFIYIESQFFISAHNAGGLRPMDAENRIAMALAERIGHHIVSHHHFHVYIVLPSHPEGEAASNAVAAQQWAAMQTIYASGWGSLIGRIKVTLKTCGRNEDEWVQYLTILNLRSYGVTVQYARDPKTLMEDYACEIGRYVVTEQVYIHSKIMIVDDMVAIVGSANLNDRSLTGKGDTEIAAVILDEEVACYGEDLGEDRQKQNTRTFARELRRGLWEKHFGFLIEPSSKEEAPPPGSKGYFPSQGRARRRAREMNLRIDFPNGPKHPPRERTTVEQFGASGDATWQRILDKPCDPVVVSAIQKIARKNRATYEAVFTHTPRNSMKKFGDPADLYRQPYGSAVENLATGTPVSFDFDAAMFIAKRSLLEESGSSEIQTWGVIPPKLQRSYMTSTLLPHQAKAALISLQDRAKRYVTYDGGEVHDVARALDFLQRNVVGFFIEMPLEWGSEEDGGSLRIVFPDALTQDETLNNTEGYS